MYSIEALVEENNRRREEIFGPYDPVTGIGCYGHGDVCDSARRVKVCIPDFVTPEVWIPKLVSENVLWRAVIEHGSVRSFIVDYWKKNYTDALSKMVCMEMCKVRMREDPEYAMYMCDKIEDKRTGEMMNFRLNYPQRKLLALMESMRHEGRAIRVIILKARQWGGSTLSQLYIKWMQDFRHDGWNAIILSQVKGTSKKIKSMYRKALDEHPGWTVGYPGVKLQFSPYENSSDDFIVTDGMRALRRSTLTVASFENFDSVRGSNFHCAHFSEVAYWKKSDEHDPEGVISSISAGIRNQPDNVEIFESTGRGASGFFYDKCQRAMTDPTDAYKFLFIPCFIIENDMEDVGDPKEFAEWLLLNRNKSTFPAGYREEGKFFWRMWELGACFEAINWYRNFRNKFAAHSYMATEAPIDEVEAFRNSGNLIFNPYSIEELERECVRDEVYWADVEPASSGSGWGGGGSLRDRKRSKAGMGSVKVRDDKTGEMKIWAMPNNNILQVVNRYVVSVDIGGSSSTSDYSVMTVIDRKGTIPGMHGRLEVVARWRSHCRHDILAWKAVALAHFYDDALLVIESNTADRERNNNTEGDHFGTIIEEISDFYPNLYRRNASPEMVLDKVEMKYGFQTNKLTKGWLIDNLIACVDDKLWDEPDREMYRELRLYERKDDGSMGNIAGADNHDDVLMSTAIGLWVSMNDMGRAEWSNKERVARPRILVGTEAGF